MATAPSYISREQLSALLLDVSHKPSSLAIIDVRDDDHVGGHILGSTHVPSGSLDYKIPQLVRELKDKEKVVFHCALSQQRGPAAARRYIQHRNQERQKDLEAKKFADTSSNLKDVSGVTEAERVQEIFILDGGFVKWQELYGTNKQLTEAYAEDVWKYDY